MQEDDLAFATIAEVGDLLRAGETTSVALTELMLARIAALDGRLNAFITVTEDLALQQAEAADAALEAGHDAGPLHGIPVAVKDIFDTAGVRTTNGSKLFAERVPADDATAVVRLQEAGAVLLGKTNLHELAWGTTSINPYFGPVANPWAPDHHPGGSSGGSAAAVAAGMAYAALGTDTGCSVRQPAHCCGITGLKPTFGRVSKAGVFALVWSHDHVGPLTRSVADAATLLDVLAGPDPDDPYSVDAPDTDIVPIDAPIEGLRIAVPRPYFYEGGDPEVVAVVDQALATFEGLGVTLVDRELPNTDAEALEGG
jgi:aspartyl-tRNA(Asn)/glutamyl-tRNA(Gln) amidotransferase subunit A